ncbi:MAG: CTP synthase [Planctomycetes bacterium]|nr:CTP synthase [Planctomycetota bacterium]MCB9824553.1 CTP synthase [Planctomycetota bacterium]MCB9829692.1 CTP synthase [Planctomycetota bacterium]MCB9900035.1 CTP synthase [Planctomycetota bacterium]
MTKYIFVTGGVVSSLGKGLTSAAMGLLLEGRGIRVQHQKLDPYLNVDPGTMSPYQHGEVYVTEDGAETDLDLGHYERFTSGAILTKDSNYTTGKIYSTIIAKERRGDYLGRTVQVIPHVTDEIKAAIRRGAGDADVLICELGGTVGDIEGLPFLEAIRQFLLDVGRENAMVAHLTYIPYLRTSGELKSKPSQHSVQKLREIGIQPDVLICRTELPLDEDMKKKLSLFCNVPTGSVVEEQDVPTSIYELPQMLAEQRLDRLIVDRLSLPSGELKLERYHELLERIRNPRGQVEVALVGKYIELGDAYKSVNESLAHGGFACEHKVRIRRVGSEDLKAGNIAERLGGVHGVVVPGGFGKRGIEGKIAAIRWARENNVPFLGLCLGMQCAVIEFSRNVAHLEGADSAEFNPDSPHPVIDLMPDQEGLEKGGTMRLGAYRCLLRAGTRSRSLYGDESISERHRHRYEFNNAYRERLEAAGLVIAGTNPERDLVEIVELANHPYFIGVQFHPEFKSKPTRPHPLFRGFIEAALAHKGVSVAAAARD